MSPVRAYVALTGLIFALIFAAHVARVYLEGTHLLGEPVMIATSLLSLGLSLWALLILVRRPS